jgi:hypothetical protein
VNQFFIGYSTTFLANATGELICFANDAFGLYWNNIGSLNVTVTRLSWPPTNGSYYQENYIPACDSALAIYNPNLPCYSETSEISYNNQWID